MREEDKELNEMLQEASDMPSLGSPMHYGVGLMIKEDVKMTGANCQWATSDGTTYVPATYTVKEIPPGVYEVEASMKGPYLVKIKQKTEGLFRLKNSNIDVIIETIEKFWDSEELYRSNSIAHKMGLLTYGSPGNGKSSLFQLVANDVIKRNGIVLKFGDPTNTASIMRTIRTIQPDIPIVVLMEDLDSTIEYYNESEVLNIIDGVEQVNKCLFLASTNYPQKLGARIINRPSRFDKRYKIGLPDKASRREYFGFLAKDAKNILDTTLDKWSEDTKGFSIAHLKELFVSVHILGEDYKDTLDLLSTMKTSISSEDDKGKMGFLNASGSD